MKVHFFGRLAETVGADIEVDIAGNCSVADVRRRIAAAYPDAASAMVSRRVRACVGDTVVPDSFVVRPADSIDFFPPVSGG